MAPPSTLLSNTQTRPRIQLPIPVHVPEDPTAPQPFERPRIDLPTPVAKKKFAPDGWLITSPSKKQRILLGRRQKLGIEKRQPQTNNLSQRLWDGARDPGDTASSDDISVSPMSDGGDDQVLMMAVDTYDPTPRNATLQVDVYGTGNRTADWDEEYECYVELALAEGIGFCVISSTVFVVQHWDTRTMNGTDTWYHLERRYIGGSPKIACYCPVARRGELCIHARYMRDYGVELYPEPEHHNEVPCAIFSRQDWQGEIHINHFSVAAPNSVLVKHRVIVVHEGDDAGGGTWKCSKHSNMMTCGHIGQAQHYLEASLGVRRCGVNEETPEDMARYLAPQLHTRGPKFGAISYLPILPPLWTALSSDEALYKRPEPVQFAPETILKLDELSSCSCELRRSFYDPREPIILNPCILYGLTRAFKYQTELQICKTCIGGRRHRYIGPEPRNLGIFNFNNRVFVCHNVLDDYTNAYTSSETPFTAWVTAMSRRYIAEGSSVPFMSEGMFRTIWFAYVNLQQFEGDMKCPRCGPTPEVTIWDGVTLGFHEKHLLPTLQPPTKTHESSVNREAKSIQNQQVLTDKQLRQDVKKIVMLRRSKAKAQQSTADTVTSGEDTENEDMPSRHRDEESSSRDERKDTIARIPGVVEKLKALNESLGEVFETLFGLNPSGFIIKPPKEYEDLFLQFCSNDSVLQMMTQTSLDAVQRFISNPTKTNVSHLVEIPSLYRVLALYKEDHIPVQAVELCKWLHKRASKVLNKLLDTNGAESPVDLSFNNDLDWRKTGCCYSIPQVRYRPNYPRLKYDAAPEKKRSKRGTCSKYYATYGSGRLVGGIMAVWCTHSVCYGFHFIPKAEGRNDVFSAIYTRWKVAPKHVIYDFACALGPYAMTREPKFFKDTKMTVDLFHKTNHSSCSDAAFLETYMAVDPRLAHVNSSAAECGNNGIKRIRKSVSYMSQERAILYTKVFISVWNRQRIGKISIQ